MSKYIYKCEIDGETKTIDIYQCLNYNDKSICVSKVNVANYKYHNVAQLQMIMLKHRCSELTVKNGKQTYGGSYIQQDGNNLYILVPIDGTQKEYGYTTVVI